MGPSNNCCHENTLSASLNMLFFWASIERFGIINGVRLFHWTLGWETTIWKWGEHGTFFILYGAFLKLSVVCGLRTELLYLTRILAEVVIEWGNWRQSTSAPLSNHLADNWTISKHVRISPRACLQKRTKKYFQIFFVSRSVVSKSRILLQSVRGEDRSSHSSSPRLLSLHCVG